MNIRCPYPDDDHQDDQDRIINTGETAEDNVSGTPPENEKDETAATASSESKNSTREGEEITRSDTSKTVPYLTSKVQEEVTGDSGPSIRNKILAARKTPAEVARLVAAREEQLAISVVKRPADGAYWRVRTDDEWNPELSEVLLLPRKDGGGPEFLLVLPELEPVFQADPRLRNLVSYFYLAFVTDTRGRYAWWAVPSRSDNSWHVSARTAMRRLVSDWAMLKSDQGAKGYKLEKPIDHLDEPVWPQGSHDDWFIKGFSDKLIDSSDHPVLIELQGRKS